MPVQLKRRHFAILLSALMLCGCTSNREPAKAIADTGITLSARAETSIGETSAGLEEYLETQFLLSGISARPEPDTKLVERIVNIQVMLAARQAMLADLGRTYTALKALAEYDAAAAVKGSVGSLVESVNAYGAAVDPDAAPVFSQPEADLISEAAAGIAQLYQNDRIRKSSALVRQILEKVIPLMKREAAVYKSLDTVVTTTSAVAATELFNLGVGRPHPLLKEKLGNIGLEYDPAQVNKVMDAAATTAPAAPSAAKEKIAKGVSKSVLWRAQRRANLRDSVITETVRALEELMKEHEKLERGAQLDLATVSAHLDLLQHYVGLVRDAAASDKPDEAADEDDKK